MELSGPSDHNHTHPFSLSVSTGLIVVFFNSVVDPAVLGPVPKFRLVTRVRARARARI